MRKTDTEILYEKEPDIEAIMDKHSVGRHDLVFVASSVARTLGVSPKTALMTLQEVDDIEAYLLSLKFKENG